MKTTLGSTGVARVLVVLGLSIGGCSEKPESVKLSRTGFVERDGARLRYTVAGNGVPLIVIPGGPGFGYTYLYDDLTRLLADRYQLVFYDQRGSGGSSGGEDSLRLTMAAYVADLDALRAAAGIQRVNLLGHSFGGLLAMHYAMAHPNRVASLILMDSDPGSWTLWRQFSTVIESRRVDTDTRALRAIQAVSGWERRPQDVERYFRVLLRPYFVDGSHAERLRFGFDERSVLQRELTYRHIRDDLGQWDIHSDLKSISSPTLVVYGAETIFPREAGERLRAGIPKARLVVIDAAGHFPHMEAPDTFTAAVRQFLRPR